MQQWEQALNRFIEPWKNDERVLAALVCGSYALGVPREHSDIDVHIILSDLEEWRERGTVIVDGFLIEYFINPVKQIKRYFESDYDDMRPHAMVQFINNRVLFDKTGITTQLRNEAEEYMSLGTPPMTGQTLQLTKYAIWDIHDNVSDAFVRGARDFAFVYYNGLRLLFDQYNRFLQSPGVPFYQIYDYLTDELYQKKYLAEEMPDQAFAYLYEAAIIESERTQQMKLFSDLVEFTLQRMGGFELDGWSFKNPVEKTENIRLLNQKDEKTAAGIYELQQKAYVLEAVIIGYAMLPPLHEQIEDIQQLDETIYGYWHDGHLVGLIGVQLSGDTLDISRLAVHPEYKRKGYGHALVMHILSLRGQWNAIRVTTGKLNKPALALYEQLGFTPVRTFTTDDELQLIELVHENGYSKPRLG